MGNPGKSYESTRHNIGFVWMDFALEQISNELRLPTWTDKFEAKYMSFEWQGVEAHLLKPQSYMNLSGKSLSLWRKRHPQVEAVTIIADDLDVELGQIRLRKKGGAAGHNGLKSIFEAWGSQDIPRLKIGIGRPPAGMDAADFVLQKFKPDERQKLADCLGVAGEHLKVMLFAESVDRAMNVVNAWRPEKESDS